MIHYIKCQVPYYEATMRGVKTFEYRKNDRQYEVGDRLHLLETDIEGHITGAYVECDVLYKFEGVFGLPSGWCIMAIRRV
jgi:ParB family chromosome partitioning protein